MNYLRYYYKEQSYYEDEEVLKSLNLVDSKKEIKNEKLPEYYIFIYIFSFLGIKISIILLSFLFWIAQNIITKLQTVELTKIETSNTDIVTNMITILFTFVSSLFPFFWIIFWFILISRFMRVFLDWNR